MCFQVYSHMAEFLINSQNSAQKGDFTPTFLNVKNLENVVFSRFLLAFTFIIDTGNHLIDNTHS